MPRIAPLALLLLALCPLASAHAKPASQAALAQRLASAQGDDLAATVDALITRGDSTAADALASFLRAGQPDATTDRVLERMTVAPFPAGFSMLTEFTHHRRAQVRRLAYRALAALGEDTRRGVDAQSVDAILARGLRDSDPGVRGDCASSLGTRNATTQLDMLFRALGRGVPEAGAAIGRIGDAAAVLRFHTYLGDRPIQVMLAGYERFLDRAEVNEDVKLDIVGRLGEVASPSVKHFLERVLATADLPKTSRLGHALRETAKRIDDRRTPTPVPGAPRIAPAPGATP